jgi:hypothetical protein
VARLVLDDLDHVHGSVGLGHSDVVHGVEVVVMMHHFLVVHVLVVVMVVQGIAHALHPLFLVALFHFLALPAISGQ